RNEKREARNCSEASYPWRARSSSGPRFSLLPSRFSLLASPFSLLPSRFSLLASPFSHLRPPLRPARRGRRRRILRSLMFRIPAAQVLPYIEVATLPEAREIARDLHRPPRW